MTSKTAARSSEEHRRQVVNAARKAQAHRGKRRRIIVATLVFAMIAGVVGAMISTGFLVNGSL